MFSARSQVQLAGKVVKIKETCLLNHFLSKLKVYTLELKGKKSSESSADGGFQEAQLVNGWEGKEGKRRTKIFSEEGTRAVGLETCCYGVEEEWIIKVD